MYFLYFMVTNKYFLLKSHLKLKELISYVMCLLAETGCGMDSLGCIGELCTQGKEDFSLLAQPSFDIVHVVLQFLIWHLRTA